MRALRVVTGLVGAVGMILLIGCSDGGVKLVPVSGQILIDGKPLPKARIQVLVKGSRPAMAESDAEGRFSLMTFKPGDGVATGTHQVLVAAVQNPKPGLQTLHCPEKYMDPATSDLKLAVDKATDQAKLELTWGGVTGPITKKVDIE